MGGLLLVSWTGCLPPCLAAAPKVQEQVKDQDDDEGEEIIVQATRSGRNADTDPIRVELLPREEIDEKMMMTPGNVAMLVAETPGIRVQVTSPSLGGSNIRMQGLRGHYTQLLSDGLPLYGGQSTSLGLLQIPPTDLGQVEVIKGAAGALYGPSALGGVINFVSRRPSPEQETELLLNAGSRKSQDATLYNSGPLGANWGYSLTAGYSHQQRQDLDGDGWADIARYSRGTIRPRLFWDGSGGAKAYLTLGAMTEQRTGGTLPGRTVADGRPFVQSQRTRRFDAAFTAEIPLNDAVKVQLRASAENQHDDHRFGDGIEDYRHATYFAEASISARTGKASLLGGLAVQADRFRSPQFPALGYSYSVPGLFAQAEQELADNLILAASARVDAHNEYGTHFSPRLSLLYRPGPWIFRASAGRGFYAPTPFVEEIEEAGLSRLRPLHGIKPEIAKTGSVGVGYSRGPVKINATFFASSIADAVQLRTVGPSAVELVNAAGKTRTHGAEFQASYRWREFTLVTSYVYLDAHEDDPSGIGRRMVPLTPRHSASFDSMWERKGKSKLGFEAYYTGIQQLEDNPYRTQSRPFVEIGLFGELDFGRFRLFANAENILDVRQTKYDPLVLPARAPDGRWTVDEWAPTDGRVVNAGVRISFGKG
jgi:iron complex outermembrane receptor protein